MREYGETAVPRKSSWNEETENIICERIAGGESLRAITQDKNMPSASEVYRKLGDIESFRDKYARAREIQMEHHLEMIFEIADNCTDDIELIRDSNGMQKEVIKHSAIQRARLQIDARKWAMSKLAPKKYGDKLLNEHSGKIAVVNIVDDIPE